jgi:3-phenylpropionate/trans-cinnamate dioxygenase ferredoxin subunit
LRGFHLRQLDVAACRIGNDVFVIQDACTHEECALSGHGSLVGYELECLCHGSKFDVRNGKCLQGPALDDVPTFPVVVYEGVVLVRTRDGVAG